MSDDGFVNVWEIGKKRDLTLSAVFTVTNTCSPTRINVASPDKLMSDGMWPGSRVLKIPMLHRIDVNIGRLVSEVAIIANQVFP
jgi:hypothetical protein